MNFNSLMLSSSVLNSSNAYMEKHAAAIDRVDSALISFLRSSPSFFDMLFTTSINSILHV